MSALSAALSSPSIAAGPTLLDIQPFVQILLHLYLFLKKDARKEEKEAGRAKKKKKKI
jgi:hypothetical protein